MVVAWGEPGAQGTPPWGTCRPLALKFVYVDGSSALVRQLLSLLGSALPEGLLADSKCGYLLRPCPPPPKRGQSISPLHVVCLTPSISGLQPSPSRSGGWDQALCRSAMPVAVVFMADSSSFSVLGVPQPSFHQCGTAASAGLCWNRRCFPPSQHDARACRRGGDSQAPAETPRFLAALSAKLLGVAGREPAARCRLPPR